MEVVFYNGEFIADRDVLIPSNSRSFNYGDGFFETIKIINSKPFNFSYHFERINFSLGILKLDNSCTKTFFQEKISYLLKVNQIVNGSVKIHISRSAAGKYLPESNNLEIFISARNGHAYKKNNPIDLCFYNEEYKAPGFLSNLKSSSSLIYVLSSIYAHKNNFDNALLLNTSGNVIEATNSNFFIIKDKKVYTSPLSDGCVDGTMRRWVKNELDVFEKSILKNEVLDAEEVFITNAKSGVISVKTIELTSFSSFNTANCLQKRLI